MIAWACAPPCPRQLRRGRRRRKLPTPIASRCRAGAPSSGATTGEALRAARARRRRKSGRAGRALSLCPRARRTPAAGTQALDEYERVIAAGARVPPAFLARALFEAAALVEGAVTPSARSSITIARRRRSAPTATRSMRRNAPSAACAAADRRADHVARSSPRSLEPPSIATVGDAPRRRSSGMKTRDESRRIRASADTMPP